MLNQVVAGLDSWVEITKNHVARLVLCSSLSDDVKRDLLRINRRGWWYHTDVELPTIVIDPITGIEPWTRA